MEASFALSDASTTVVPVPLFNSSGGATLNASDVWGQDLPWARSVEDPWSLKSKNNPQYAQWTPVRRGPEQVSAAFGLDDVVQLAEPAGGPIHSQFIGRMRVGHNASK